MYGFPARSPKCQANFCCYFGPCVRAFWSGKQAGSQSATTVKCEDDGPRVSCKTWKTELSFERSRFFPCLFYAEILRGKVNLCSDFREKSKKKIQNRKVQCKRWCTETSMPAQNKFLSLRRNSGKTVSCSVPMMRLWVLCVCFYSYRWGRLTRGRSLAMWVPPNYLIPKNDGHKFALDIYQVPLGSLGRHFIRVRFFMCSFLRVK